MIRPRAPHERGLRWGIVASVILHLSLFAVVLRYRFPPPAPKEAPVYYVDVVNLPVAAPQAGSPTVAAGAPPKPLPPSPLKQEMALPRTPSPAKAPAEKRPSPSPAEESGREFEERLSKLQRDIDERRQESALDALRRKVTGSARAPEQPGMPGGTGAQAGSDYASYIQSRLRDAFRSTIAHQTKAPEVVLRLTIDAGGRVVRQRLERSTGDRIFEESVQKAITIAAKNFPPPPGANEFETGFIFRPQGVGKK